MATTPEGSPYVESSDLVATYPTTSLALANRVDLVGVLPFADSTARGTAIPSPSDGQYSYLQDTNSTEFWNGSAWVAAATAPGLVHLNTSTFTTQASVSINNVFTATYLNYRIMVNITTSSASGEVRLRLRAAGSDTTTATYTFGVGRAGRTTLSDGSGLTNATNFQIGYATTASFFNGSYDIFDANTASIARFVGNGFGLDSGPVTNFSGGICAQATAHDGYTIYPNSGTITGTIRTYGYKTS